MMKEEPFPVLNAGDDGDDDDWGGSGNGGLFMEEASQFPAIDEDIDIKHEFPIVATNPLLDLELEMEPGQTSPDPAGLTKDDRLLNPNSGFYLNEYDGDGNQAELEEINAITNSGEVDVQEVKPIAIPIPISNDEEVDDINEDDDPREELEEMGGIINCNGGGEVDVRDVKPIAIPIPIILPAHLASNEIIINHYKPKPKGHWAKTKPCICTICHTGFPSQQLFQLHMSDVHADERPFSCSQCGKGFATAAESAQHETIHDPNRFKGEPKFACDLCDKKYHLRASLVSHRRVQHFGYTKPPPPRQNKVVTEHHAVGVRNHQPQKKEVRVFKCPYCDLKFAMRCLVRKHLLCHTKERSYQCTECEQRCASQNTLQAHIRSRHLNPSTNPRPSRPKSMSNQPCPCTVCGKVFKVPSQLQKHFRVHSGEKPHECPVCGQRFSLKEGLRRHRQRRHETPNGQVNDNVAYKCLICGKGGFFVYSDLRNHRMKVHRHIPMPEDSDKESPFACGICGKPYNTKGHAMVCAVLKHDPKSLLAAMFKYKCPGCPEERFGYHSTFALRKHWEKEHVDKPLPVQYRAPSGMYENREVDAIPLPSVTVNKELARRIRENGPEDKYEYPLYVEFDLLPVATKFYREVKKGRKRKSAKPKPPEINFTCNICGVAIVHKRNFKRHMENHNKGGGVNSHYNCDVCGKRFGKMKTLRSHQRQHNLKTAADAPAPIKRRPGRPAKCHSKLELIASTNTSTKLNQDNFTNNASFTVNVKDATAIRSVLGNRIASIILPRANYKRTTK